MADPSNRGRSTHSKLTIRRKLQFLGIMFVLVLLAGEGLARILARGSGPGQNFVMRQGLEIDQQRDVIREPFPGVPYLYAPEAPFSQRWPSNPRNYFDEPGHKLTYRVNKQGFRGANFAAHRSAGLRVAFLGDSFCWGLGVRQEDHFITRLGRTLESRDGLGGPIQLMNFGMGGYNTSAEVALFEHAVLAYAPDVVVIWFFLNDWEQGGQLAATSRYLSGKRLWRPARQCSRLLDVLVSPIDDWVGRRSLIETFVGAYEDGSPGWEAVQVAFDRFASLCREKRIAPVLVIHPVLVDLDEHYPFIALHRKIAARASVSGLTVIDLLEAFEGQDAKTLWVHPLDQHPNEIAHRIAGDYLFENLSPLLRSALRKTAIDQ